MISRFTSNARSRLFFNVVVALTLVSVALAQVPSNIPRDAWRRKVRAVMSGDTLAIETEQGMDEVRLACAKTPQITGAGGKPEFQSKEVRTFVQQELMNKDVWIVFDNQRNEPRRDHDGRYFAYVYYEKIVQAGPDNAPTQSVMMLNQELIARGFARVDAINPCGKRLEFNALQREAKRQMLGVWQNQPQ